MYLVHRTLHNSSPQPVSCSGWTGHSCFLTSIFQTDRLCSRHSNIDYRFPTSTINRRMSTSISESSTSFRKEKGGVSEKSSVAILRYLNASANVSYLDRGSWCLNHALYLSLFRVELATCKSGIYLGLSIRQKYQHYRRRGPFAAARYLMIYFGLSL